MASAVRVASRSFANRSGIFVQSSTTPFVFPSSSLTRIPRALRYSMLQSTILIDMHCLLRLTLWMNFAFDRVLSVVRSVESLMPLHSAIANARLTSNIAFDSSCWSLLSRGTTSMLLLKYTTRSFTRNWIDNGTIGVVLSVLHYACS